MDYKYIEQLLERYWEANTTPQEENILRAFFSQDMLPEHLAQYQPLFVYEQTAANEQPLGDDFDRRMLERIGQGTAEAEKKVVVKAQRITNAIDAAFLAPTVSRLLRIRSPNAARYMPLSLQ